MWQTWENIGGDNIHQTVSISHHTASLFSSLAFAFLRETSQQGNHDSCFFASPYSRRTRMGKAYRSFPVKGPRSNSRTRRSCSSLSFRGHSTRGLAEAASAKAGLRRSQASPLGVIKRISAPGCRLDESGLSLR